jgi:hypothetical protein
VSKQIDMNTLSFIAKAIGVRVKIEQNQYIEGFETQRIENYREFF